MWVRGEGMGSQGRRVRAKSSTQRVWPGDWVAGWAVPELGTLGQGAQWELKGRRLEEAWRMTRRKRRA